MDKNNRNRYKSHQMEKRLHPMLLMVFYNHPNVQILYIFRLGLGITEYLYHILVHHNLQLLVHLFRFRSSAITHAEYSSSSVNFEYEIQPGSEI
jgi:hypothetical protein